MALEAGECNGVREGAGAEFERKGAPELAAQEDVKRSGECNGIACGEVEDADGVAKDDVVDGSYVFVNGESDELSERDLDVVDEADLAGSQKAELSVESDDLSDRDLSEDGKVETRISGVDAELDGRTSDCIESNDQAAEKGDLVSALEEVDSKEEEKGELIVENGHNREEAGAPNLDLVVGTADIQEETTTGDVVEGHSVPEPVTEIEDVVPSKEQESGESLGDVICNHDGLRGEILVNCKAGGQEDGESVTAIPFETKGEDSEPVVAETTGSASLSLVNGNETMSLNAEDRTPAEDQSDIVVLVTHKSESLPLGDEETLASNGTEENQAAEQAEIVVTERSGSELLSHGGEETLTSNGTEDKTAAEQAKIVIIERSGSESVPLGDEETLASNDTEDNPSAEQAKIVLTESSGLESVPLAEEETLTSNGREDNPQSKQSKTVISERSESESLPLVSEEEAVRLNSAEIIPAVEEFSQSRMEPESETQSRVEFGDKSHENNQIMAIVTVDEVKIEAVIYAQESSERMSSCSVRQPDAEDEATEVHVVSTESSSSFPLDDEGLVKEVKGSGDDAKVEQKNGEESAENREDVAGCFANDTDSRTVNEGITTGDKVDSSSPINGMEPEPEALIHSLKSQDFVSPCPEVETRLEESGETSTAIPGDDMIPVTEEEKLEESEETLSAIPGDDTIPATEENGENTSAIPNNDTTPISEEESGETASATPDNDTTSVTEDNPVENDKDTPNNDADDVKLESKIKSGPVEHGESMTDSIEEIQSANKDDPDTPASAEDNVTERGPENEVLVAPVDDTGSLSLPGQKVDTDVKNLPVFMIRVPRFSDEKLKMQIQHAQQEVDEKTGSRDSIRVAMQKQKGICAEYWRKVEDARKGERAARDAVAFKRQEIDSIQSMLSKLKNATSISDIDNRIHKLQHRISHETNTLKEEKSLIREMNQLKQSREQLSSSLASEEELQEAFEKQEQMETRLKHLKDELDTLRKDTLRAEGNTKDAKAKYDNQCEPLRDLQTQFKAADDLRQEAYTNLRNLKKESYEKNQYFYSYKDDMKIATNYSFSGDRDALRSHCTKQVEKMMELWNKNDEFRHQYVKANLPSTLRRFRTLDGRSLGPDEQPAIIHNPAPQKENFASPLVSRSNTPALVTERKQEIADAPLSAAKMNSTDGPTVAQKSQSQKSKKVAKPATSEVVANRETDKEEAEKETKPTAEELEQARKAEELARKEEELRKKKEAAEMKEQHRLEQIAKAKEAEERKKRKAEKAQAKAEIKAQKEAELREKKREKKEKKKERKSTGTTAENVGEAELPASLSETTVETVQEQPEKTASVAPSKRPSRPRAAPTKEYNKVKPLPPPLRSRGKRKMQTWMWALLTALLVLALFLAGNYVSFPKFGLRNFSF